MDIENPLKLITNKLEVWLENFIVMLPNLVIGTIVLVAFYFLARVVKNISLKFLNKILNAKPAIKLLANAIFTIVIVFGFFITLELLQLSKAVTTLLAGAGIIGLALSFAFQDIASNFVSGLLIVTRKPFKVNDIIESNDYFGKVIDINLRNTLIQTFQGQVVLIPNKMVFENAIINYTYTGERRIDLSVGVSYGDNLEKVQQVTTSTIKQLPDIIKDKGVLFTFNEFGNSSINLKVRFWVKYNKQDKDYLPALTDAIIKLKKAYDENDIMIPFPIRTLDFGIKGGKQFKEMINGEDGSKKTSEIKSYKF